MKPPELTPDELYAELVMSRAARRDITFMVLEGDDDQRFWLSFVDRRSCTLYPAHGKRNVEACIRLVDLDGLPGVLGIVDTDLDAVEGTFALVSSNLIRTADYDLEGMLLQSSAFHRLLNEHGDLQQIEAFEAAAGHDLREALVRRALPFGQLRWLARRAVLSLKPISPGRFIRSEDWSLAVEDLYTEAARQSCITIAELRGHLDALPDVRPWAICQGHDLLLILRIALQGPLGSNRQIPSDGFARPLRQAFQNEEFRASSIHRDLRAWEGRNPPYRVLPAA